MVCGIWNSREKLLSSAAATPKRCRLRGSAFSKVEEALVKWLKAARSKNLPISRPLLVEKALVFVSQLNHGNIVCNNVWLARFKARHGITTRTVSGEGAAADVDGAEQWQNDDASDTIDQTSDIVDKACKTLLAEVLEWQGVTEGISFPDFRDADSGVQTSPDMSDEAIVASVVEMSPNDSDEDDMESNNTGDPGPTVAEGAHCVSVVREVEEIKKKLKLDMHLDQYFVDANEVRVLLGFVGDFQH
ncbi:hypothetical protein HPB51_004073 [Rhipicephalus microplus]|uniref:HTH CENPB-type domain-containing protein n=1 Tax=Rhipicephalus microplus TaxID=6941 RepID=A0A9J6EXD5_RHIMP|nr:hypothetical protein HPB51_004073 [Rhipicephalus microplus]